MGQDDNHWCELGFAEPAVVFKGPTQTARSVTEAWVALHGFYPNCAADRLPQLPNNSPVADFRCDACGEEYELKDKQGKLGRSIPDGAFGAMTARLKATGASHKQLRTPKTSLPKSSPTLSTPCPVAPRAVSQSARPGLATPYGPSVPSQGGLVGRRPNGGGSGRSGVEAFSLQPVDTRGGSPARVEGDTRTVPGQSRHGTACPPGALR